MGALKKTAKRSTKKTATKKRTTKRTTTKRSVTKKPATKRVVKKTTQKKTVGKRRKPTPRLNPNLKKRNYERPSPAVSATRYPIGYRKKGNDGNMYKIMRTVSGIHRWIKA